MSADAVETLVLIFVSVKRPVTNEGLMSNVTPFPFDVEIFAVNDDAGIPPLRTPPPPIEHAAALPLALKLPLDWADAWDARETRAKMDRATPIPVIDFFIYLGWDRNCC